MLIIFSEFFVLVKAESAMDQMDWIEKITGVIASLLSSQSPEQVQIPTLIINTIYILFGGNELNKQCIGFTFI